MNVFWEKESPRRFAAPPFDKGGFGGRGTFGEPLGLPFRRAPSSASHALGTFPLEGGRYGRVVDPPLRRKRTGGDGSAKPGAWPEPHQLSFLQTQGPVAREKSRIATQILRAGSSALSHRHASPVMGVQGDGEYERGALILSHPPGGSLVTFWPARKSLAARRRRTIPTKGEDPLWQPKPF